MFHDPQTTPREPKSPNFYEQADYFLGGFPGMISCKDYHLCRGKLAEIFTTMFVMGMDEAKERIRHNPKLGI